MSDDAAERGLALAVNEACANAVRHAYPSGSGDLRVEVSLPRADTFLVVIEDDGVGVDPSPHDSGSGYGLRLMELSSRLTIHSNRRGTRVEMSFDCQSLAHGRPSRAHEASRVDARRS
jgi:two-component sensor histidine kinase